MTARDPVTGRRSYQIISCASHILYTTMTVAPEELEAAIRAKIQVTHVEVQDNSGGCGEKYAVLIVSKVL